MEKTICELFAGVGGFRLGFERLNSGWKTVWFSQWEPGAKNQWAHECYVKHFGDSKDLNGEYHTCEDIAMIDKKSIPNHTLLVGGFPCQDYSVAHSLKSSMGIEGKKGVLWWEIRNTLIEKNTPFCLFENVDRLVKSPANQRGRDFGIMLACLNELDYSVEWRVINAADYGAAQRRRRIYIFAYKNDTKYGKKMSLFDEQTILLNKGVLSQAFPVKESQNIDFIELQSSIIDISDNFLFSFKNSGFMRNGKISTIELEPLQEKPTNLKDILEVNVNEKYYIPLDKMQKWIYLKGAKKIPRKTASGHEYIFSEGPVSFPDSWDKPGRTMLTSEGTLNRSTHVVTDCSTGKLRLITPLEAERMQGFDDNWTNTGMPDRMRYFCMGNALVVPMITRAGKIIQYIIEDE